MRYEAVTPEPYRGFGFPGAEDIGNMFRFKRDFGKYFCGAGSGAVAREQNEQLQSCSVWLEQSRDRIAL